MNVEITVSSTLGLPDAAGFDGSRLCLACLDANIAYLVLRRIMDYSYEHPDMPSVTLVCANEEVAAAYRFQWNMWYAERRPD